MNKFGQNTDQPAVYFNKLYMKNVRCFKGNHEIDLGNGKGEPSQWTVILGNNNVGKTTILRVIAGTEYVAYDRSGRNSGYKGTFIFSHKKDTSFNEIFFLLGNEIVIRKGKAFETVAAFRFKEGLEDSFFTKDLSDEDLKWIENLKVSSFMAKSEDAGAFGYPKFSYEMIALKIFGYGTTRLMIDGQSEMADNTQGIFLNKTLLLNVEEWLKDLYFAYTQEVKGADIRYRQVENIFCGGLLPEVTEIRITTIPDKSSFETFPEFLTSQGWVRLEDLGYGYQATLAWVADLAKRMFDQYPDLENPLHGPAVVLVDEIDLHLHPEWQRKIIKYLSDLFPNTQFIVTAHSPLIIQSAENVNLIMLEKDDNPDGKGINIRQRFGSFQGWTVDEILTELMNMGDRTRSDLYLQLMQDFENAVLDDDYEKAQDAYNQLDTILSPSSYQRKVLQIQMSSLIPVGV